MKDRYEAYVGIPERAGGVRLERDQRHAARLNLLFGMTMLPAGFRFRAWPLAVFAAVYSGVALLALRQRWYLLIGPEALLLHNSLSTSDHIMRRGEVAFGVLLETHESERAGRSQEIRWRVEIRDRTGATFAGRSGYLVLRQEEAAQRLAHRLSRALSVPLRTGSTEELAGTVVVEERLAG